MTNKGLIYVIASPTGEYNSSCTTADVEDWCISELVCFTFHVCLLRENAEIIWCYASAAETVKEIQ